MDERRRRTNLGCQQQYLYVHATYGSWRQANRAYTLTGTIRRCGCSQHGPNSANMARFEAHPEHLSEALADEDVTAPDQLL
jgi:hypothetical protein